LRRLDDMLKVGGIYVSPFEVEAALSTHGRRARMRPWSAMPTSTSWSKPRAFVVLKNAARLAGARRRAAGACQGTARAVQVPALDRVRHRPAEDRDRKIQSLQLRQT